MGEEIIAEKYALIRTRGSNGVAFTHLVEDIVLGDRVVVKVSDKLGPLCLEYIKTANLLKEIPVPGMLTPLEGGILEEEAGCYLSFPQVGEPSMENYLGMGMPLSCGEIARILKETALVLRDMHRAGFYHLFLNTHNIFYRPRGRILLKDPALKPKFFSPLLEVVARPDFSYFSPRVMDGGGLEAGADIYAMGRLAERLLDKVEQGSASPAREAVERIAEACRCRNLTAEGLLDYIDEVEASCSTASCGAVVPGRPERPEGGERENLEAPFPTGAPVKSPKKGGGRSAVKRLANAVLILAALCVLSAGLLMVSNLRQREGPAATVDAVGKSAAGLGNAAAARLEKEAETAGEGPEEEAPEGGDSAETADLSPEEEPAAADDGLPAGAEGWDIETSIPAEEPEEAAEVVEASPELPVAGFTLTPPEGRSPLRVYLDASSSYDPDGTIVSYSWSFGASGSAVYHVFESNIIPASMSVTLTVTDDGGHSATATRSVTVY